MAQYQVVVGNIGTVYDGNDETEARKEEYDARIMSLNGYGKYAGEPVTLFKDGEIIQEYEGCKWLWQDNN